MTSPSSQDSPENGRPHFGGLERLAAWTGARLPGRSAAATWRARAATPIGKAAIGGAALAVILWAITVSSWLCDDAFITFRSIEQLFAGNGLRFNPHERVQAFTHPLWLSLLIVPRLFGVSLPVAALQLSAVLTLATYALLFWASRTRATRWWLLLGAALGSRTLLDYSSSGLETPLSLFLLALFAHLVLRTFEAPAVGTAARHIAFVASMALLARHDHALVVAPALALVFWRRSKESGNRWLREALVGFAPFAAWSLFALLYYGSPFPNTALAKLAAGVARSELLAQGLRYLAKSLAWDPILGLLVVGGVVASIAAGAGARALAAGAGLQLVYVVSIGGDFMAGRFLLPAAVVGMVLLLRCAPAWWIAPLAAGCLAWALFAPRSVFDSARRFEPAWRAASPGSAGIEDHKGEETARMALLASGAIEPMSEPLGPPHRVRSLGVPGYRAHPAQVLVDPFALADPFLARLSYEPPWRAGHFRRRIPEGYLESLATGENLLIDPELAELYATVRYLTSGPLLDPRRLWLSVRLLFHPIVVAPTDARCPALVVLALEATPSRVHGYPLDLRAAVDGQRLLLVGTAALGEHVQRWQVELRTGKRPLRSSRRCHLARDRAPFEIEIQLEYSNEEEARRAAASPWRARIVRAEP